MKIGQQRIGSNVFGGQLLAGAAVLALLTGCAGGGFNPFARNDEAAADTSVATQKSVRLIDRDVEAPNVFSASDDALWDGRPSLGGVWVASADAIDPERVIMRNPANGKFVIGALFKRERDNPGPNLQISSDAAAALGLLAGQPGKINVTALRREEAKPAVDASKPILDAAETLQTENAQTENAQAGSTQVGGVQTQKLNPVAGAAAALARVDAAPPARQPLAPTISANPAAGGGTGALIQIGIFSIEANAKRTVQTLTAAGVNAAMRTEISQGKTFWSVTARGDGAALGKIKSAGFKDAYFLKG